VSHDAVSDYLRNDNLTPRALWERIQPLLKDSEEAYLLVDDSVQNKQYSQRIERVKQQYSGAEHGLVRGIGVVNLVHSDGEVFYPIDYRIYAPEQEGKSKNEHFREMLIRATGDKHWTADALEHGLSVRLKDLPFRVQLFKVVATNGDIDWLVTNHLTLHDLQAKNAVRWLIEQLHRELKQLTGTEKCECRKARSQRNPLGCCYHAWLALRL
jgi:hypothetical protein